MKLFYLCVKPRESSDQAIKTWSHIREAFIDEEKAIRKCEDLQVAETEKKELDPEYHCKEWAIYQASIDDIDDVEMFEIWKQVDPYKKHRKPHPKKPLVVLRKTTPRISRL